MAAKVSMATLRVLGPSSGSGPGELYWRIHCEGRRAVLVAVPVAVLAAVLAARRVEARARGASRERKGDAMLELCPGRMLWKNWSAGSTWLRRIRPVYSEIFIPLPSSGQLGCC